VRKTALALLLAALNVAAAGCAQASSDSYLRFRDTTRTLEKVQDATASGDPSAANLQSKLMIQLETDLKLANQLDLQDVKNLRAIAVYLFIGGNPGIAEVRLHQLKIDAQYKELLDGALAYAKGDKANAVKFLADVDINGLPPNLAGRIALVKAILTSAEDLRTALSLLNTARAIMPGTLVEESALRRCISFAGKLPDIERLERCASAYIRRFPKSIYRQDFEDKLALGLVEADYLIAGGTMPRLAFVLKDLPPSDSTLMLLKIAKAAVGHGRYSLAISTAEEAFKLSRAGSPEMARSNLYAGAVMIAEKDHEIGRKKLEQTNRSLLDAGDMALLEKALALARQITKKPDITEEQARKSQAPSEPNNGQSPAYTALLARANAALADTPPAK
jgi:chemotaxis protein MotC